MAAEDKHTGQSTSTEDGALEGDSRWELARRVAHSPALARAAQLRAILLYIVRQAILHSKEQIHEFEIAHRVLGRRSDFNPLDDSIVRVQMAQLRKRLDQHFSHEGKDEPVVISVGLGSYEPIFSQRLKPVDPSQSVPESGAVGNERKIGDSEGIIAPRGQEEQHTPHDLPRMALDWRWILPGVVILALAWGCVALWLQNRATQSSLDEIRQSVYGWRDLPTVGPFWTGFLRASQDTDVVMADASFSLVQVLSKRSYSLNEYLSRSYIGQSQNQPMSPDMRAAMNVIPNWNLGSKNGFYTAQRILSLDPTGKKIHLYYARDYMAALLRQDNVILLGSPIGNPWVGLFADRLNFIEKFDNAHPSSPVSIQNRKPAAGEQATYTPDGSNAYCALAYLPNPDHNGSILLFVGTDSETTQAAGDFLLSEEQLSNFQKMLHVTKLPYFEVLLKTSEVKGTPLSTTIVGYRTYPPLQ